MGDVAEHYNRRKDKSLEARSQSDMMPLRNFNNWVKAVTIQKTLDSLFYERKQKQLSKKKERKLKVLDLACGKGGDVKKYQKMSHYIDVYVGVDISSQSIEDAQKRYLLDPHFQFFSSSFFSFEKEKKEEKEQEEKEKRIEFHVGDACLVGLGVEKKVYESWGTFDAISMQFALHYAFRNENDLDQLLQNVSEKLVPGGIFFGTVPDKQKIVEFCQKQEKNSVADIVFLDDGFHHCDTIIKKEKETSEKKYGQGYRFYLKDAIDGCVEYLVDVDELEKRAERWNLRRQGFCEYLFHDFYAAHIIERKCQDMALQAFNFLGKISEDQWEVCGLYRTFSFIKV